jgi:hypothetical protein
MISPNENLVKSLRNLQIANAGAYKIVGEWITQNMLSGAMELSDIKDMNELLKASGRNQVFKMLNLYFNGSDEIISKMEEFRKQANNTGNAMG